MKWTTRLSKTKEWVCRLGFPKGDVPYPHSGFIPLRQTRIGAQVAPRRCPILRYGKSNSTVSQFVFFMKGFCVIDSLAGGFNYIRNIMMRVALIGENSIEYVNMLLDIWNNGDCAVLLDWRIPFEAAYQMMLEAGVTRCFMEARLLNKVSIPDNSKVSFSCFDIADRIPYFFTQNVRRKYRENKSKDEAVILYSSGTTGKSRGIILSHYAITTNADAILDYMKLTSNDCLYIVKSLSHSSTLTGELLAALRSGAKLVLAPTVVPPRYVLSRINDFSVTTICLNPTLLHMFIDECTKNEYNLSTLKTIYCSGSVLNDKVYAKAHDVFGGIDMFNVYGLSEAGPRVAAQTKDCCKSNSVGKSIKDVEITIVDDAGTIAKQGERGIVHVNTPSRYNGYAAGTEKHKSLYKGWLNTGDIGFIDDNGELHILDRVDDVMIIGAHKVYPGDVERLVLEDDEISGCAISKCTYNDAEIIGCLYVSNVDRTIDIIRRLKKSLMPYEIPKKFVRVDSLPVNRRGKIDKLAVSKKIESVL